MARIGILIVAVAIAGLIMSAEQGIGQTTTAGPPMMLAPPALAQSRKPVTRNAAEPPQWFADFMLCSAYRSVQLLCARAVERTDNAEKNLLACLEQEGFTDEPKQCKHTPH